MPGEATPEINLPDLATDGPLGAREEQQPPVTSHLQRNWKAPSHHCLVDEFLRQVCKAWDAAPCGHARLLDLLAIWERADSSSCLNAGGLDGPPPHS